MKVCTTKGCSSPRHSRGLCSKHYQRWWSQLPAQRAKQAAYYRRPGVREKKAAYAQRPEVKQAIAAREEAPKRKAHKRAYSKKYHQDFHKGSSEYVDQKHAYDTSPERRAAIHAHNRTVEGRFARSKAGAKSRDLAWTLTLMEYRALQDQLCRYCQFPLPVAGVGLDRILNSDGYTPLNVVPCCTSCNLARNDKFTHLEMLHDIGPVLRKVKLAREKPVAYTPEVSSTSEATHGDR